MIAMHHRKAEQDEPGAMEASIDLAADPASPAAARDFVRSILGQWRCDHLVESALLIASELVTNAVVHARSASELRLRLTDGVVRIQVADQGGGTPAPRVPDQERPGGRGLPIIEAISAAWGIDPTADGKLVWADLRG
jgi:anti-sigma regulatory factor (Ser/Thr protein kinase)